MPLVSEAQRKWMHANHPDMAARWEAETPKGAKLPARVGPPHSRPKKAKLAEVAKRLVNKP